MRRVVRRINPWLMPTQACLQRTAHQGRAPLAGFTLRVGRTHLGNQPPVHLNHPGAPRRASFAKISEPLEVPGLLDLQLDSFEWLQGSPEWRAKALARASRTPRAGFEDILHELSPIEDFSGSMSLSFSDPHFDEAKASVEECRTRT